MPPRLPTIADLPKSVRFTHKDYIVSVPKSYPSGPSVHQVRLKYPYMSAQTLADNIAYNTNTGGEKSTVVMNQLYQAMGSTGMGKLAKPVTGIHVKISGTTHVEKSFITTVQFRRGSVNQGIREHKMKTVIGRMGARTTQVTLCSSANPF